jgi:hypothetical protein
MLKVYNEMKEHKILDGILIWRKLKDEHCYIYSSSLPIDPFSPINTSAAPILANPPSEINPDTLVRHHRNRKALNDMIYMIHGMI